MPAVLTEPNVRAAEAVTEGSERGRSNRSGLGEAARSPFGSVSIRDHWRRQSAIRHTLTTPMGQK